MDLRCLLLRSSIVALAVGPAAAAAVHGCGGVEFDDLCGWLKDPESCYRTFFIDVGTRCGSVGPRPGSFAGRDKLNECYLDAGGIVEFEPPLDLTKLPGDSEEGLKMKFVNPDATECGSVQFFSKYSFSVTIKGDDLPDAGAIPDELVLGGTFSMIAGGDGDTLNTSCPSGSGFTFNRLQVTRCRELEPLLPHAEIDFNPGGVEAPGIITLRVYYPPQEGDLAGASPVPITYFECAIPGAPPLCANGMQDGAETDVDCGGNFCASKCADGQKCIVDDDCLSNECNIVMGLSQCIGP